MGDIVGARELALRFKVTPATIHAWHRRGWIPCLRAGRRPVLFDVSEVEHTLRERAAFKGVRHAS
jgi:DNA-binding transcriptional MerR regulator